MAEPGKFFHFFEEGKFKISIFPIGKYIKYANLSNSGKLQEAILVLLLFGGGEGGW